MTLIYAEFGKDYSLYRTAGTWFAWYPDTKFRAYYPLVEMKHRPQ